MEKLWTVVHFIDENAVEAVPSTWIINNKCYWPPFPKEKIVAAIKKHAKPNTCWPSHDIKTFRNNSYDNYGTAREKTRKAEFTSELNSDTERERENVKTSKRKIYSKMLSSCSNDFDEECINTKLPTPSIMQGNWSWLYVEQARSLAGA
ncbi:uncharacterized protein LOC113004968 [Solenopsis invicta]|uniref:uncharacterized protein LOC113004968 n=1 Tax=Solenopsis invicta TaxID=13686 RepID=UPI00193E1D5C|nr:uncharacterized protein LOC113004968 [Solenopsis invicta]XP_039306793.1 uncharacterized protein LOC113004968 [Solenopsis invicta]